MTLFRVAAAACLLFAASCSAPEQAERPSGAGPARVVDTELGPVLATEEGLTLYVHEEDEPSISNCIAECADIWPPFTAPADAEAAGGWSVIAREDGARQWAYGGKPLYRWLEDQQPGDITGVGIPDWQLARP